MHVSDELHLVAKLNAVAPDGHSTLLSTGWLNARHRNGTDRPEAIEPGETMQLTIPMWATSYRLPAGHRLRLTVAAADFPRLWPTRVNPSLRLHLGGAGDSAVRVPVVPPGPPVDGPSLRRPDTSENRAPWITSAAPEWELRRDQVDGTVRVTLGTDMTLDLPTGGRMHFRHGGTAKVTPTRPDAAAVEAEAAMDLRMPGGEHVVVDTISRFTRESMLMSARVLVDGRVFFEGRWSN